MKIRDVISKYSRVANRIPEIMRPSVNEAFALWNQRFPELALSAIRAAGDGDEEVMRAFVGTFNGLLAGLAMRFTLKDVPHSETEGLRDTNVHDWVAAGFAGIQGGKVLDGRDADLDTTARKMQGILIYASDASPKVRAAREKYLPQVEELMGRTGISPNQIDHWSRIVLRVWLSFVRETWPGIIRQNLRKLYR